MKVKEQDNYLVKLNNNDVNALLSRKKVNFRIIREDKYISFNLVRE